MNKDGQQSENLGEEGWTTQKKIIMIKDGQQSKNLGEQGCYKY